jgi:hypothetical protein
MKTAAQPSRQGNLTFSEFVTAVHSAAHLKLDHELAAHLELVECKGWATWLYTGRQIQIFAESSNTITARRYGRQGKAIPGSTMELNMTHRSVEKLVKMMAWLGSSEGDS